MTTDFAVPALLTELADLGVRLSLTDRGALQVTAPRGRLSAELRDRLARHKPDLVAWLGQPGGDAGLPTIVPDADRLHDPFPLADLQQSFLIGGGEGFEYHVRPHQYMEFDLDELDPPRFEAALNAVLRRHRRSLVVVRDDMSLQVVRDPEPIRVTVSDLRDLPEAQAAAELDRYRASAARAEPRHDRWPWLTPHITRYGADRARLHWNNNNIFTDAPSGSALITEALRHYRDGTPPGSELTLSFRDCVLALAKLADSPLGQASQRYWCDRLPGLPDAPALPLAAGATRRGRSRLVRRELFLDAPRWDALRRAAERRGLTTTNVLLAAHAEVLAYWSGSRHFLLNNMVSHRPMPLHPEMAEVLGNFASLYPLEVDWRPVEPFADRARRLQARVIDDVAHTYWPGSKVLQRLNQLRRTPGRAICPYAVGSALFVGPSDRPYYGLLETPQTLLDTEFWQLRDGRLLVLWDAFEQLFPDGLLDAMFAAYRGVVTDLAEDETAWHRTGFDLLPAADRARRADLNRATGPAPTGLLHGPLPSRAAETPDRPAVTGPAGTLSYRELHRRVGATAAALRDAGTRRGDRVAVLLPRGPAQVVAVHAALTAGAGYVPIDPSWPRERIRHLLADTAARAVLTDGTLGEQFDGTVPVRTVAGAATTAPGPHAPAVEQDPGDLAYVIYTSGSTGRPKGVALDHRGPVGTITEINRRFGVGADAVVFGASSLCFDLSVYDVFGTLAAGGTLVQPADTDPAGWLELVASHRVTVWNSVPALMELFVAEALAAGAVFPSLRTVLLSGDWIPVALPERIRRIAPAARVISLGGATEASIWSICFPVDDVDPAWPSIPYGRPLAQQSWHVLDALGRDAPTWVPGELHIGGRGVALGYLGDPARTAAAFVAHPRTGERLYRTGDLGRYLPGGDIEFLGRSDLQVKIQGFRVEPGEVEHALLTHPGVERAAVVARASGAGRQLAGYVTATAGAAPDAEELRGYLAKRLPGHLVPTGLAVLDELPLSPNGKLDRAALARRAPDGAADDRRGVPPRTPTEAGLADIWRGVLCTGPVGVHDDFFDLGGQSFAALRVASLVAERFGRRVPLGVLLEHRTVAELAGWLDTAAPDWTPLVRLRDGTATPWFLVHPAGGTVACYRDLADAVEGPVFALQAPGPANDQQPADTVAVLSDRHLAAILAERPHGPYRLGGWSSGAVVALELARRLEARGDRVERLAVLDAPAPLDPRPVSDLDLLAWFLEDLAGGARALRPVDRDRLAALPEPDRLAAAVQLVGAPAGLAPDDLADTYAVFRGVVRACHAYRATPVRADLTVVRARHDVVSEFAGHPSSGADDWGWSALSSGTVHASQAPGTHHTLLTDRDGVAAVAAALGPARRRPGAPDPAH